MVSCSVGVHHTLTLTACGNCYGFGLNKFYQLGNNYPQSSTFKSQQPQLLLSNVLSYAPGGRYSLILTSDHKLFSCGRNDFVQCGVGDETLMATCDYS
ncbi:hypothetical protein P9112_002737 [Eukaryota sp. TZLM1-RC]